MGGSLGTAFLRIQGDVDAQCDNARINRVIEHLGLALLHALHFALDGYKFRVPLNDGVWKQTKSGSLGTIIGRVETIERLRKK